ACRRLTNFMTLPLLRTASPSVNLRLGDPGGALQKIEVATLVRLTDMFGEHGPIAARIARRWRLPGGTAAVELVVGHVQMDTPRGHIDLDRVAALHERQRPADEAFRRHVQNAGAVAGTAHTPVG